MEARLRACGVSSPRRAVLFVLVLASLASAPISWALDVEWFVTVFALPLATAAAGFLAWRERL